MNSYDVAKELDGYATKEKAKINAQFFKTGKGEYGEGDVFIGVTVPQQRIVANNYKELPLRKVEKLLKSEVHEHRFTALLILIHRYAKEAEKGKKELVHFYSEHLEHVNSWDLVDLSAPLLLGDFCCRFGGEKKLFTLAKQKSVWLRRISIVATYAYIRKNMYTITFAIAKMLLSDKEDLIHKAVGWMLREVGKRDAQLLNEFLQQHSQEMHRTTLRYAIERFEDTERKKWLRISKKDSS